MYWYTASLPFAGIQKEVPKAAILPLPGWASQLKTKQIQTFQICYFDAPSVCTCTVHISYFCMCRCEVQQGRDKSERISEDQFKSRLHSQNIMSCCTTVYSVIWILWILCLAWKEKIIYVRLMGIVRNIVFGNKLLYYYYYFWFVGLSCI